MSGTDLPTSVDVLVLGSGAAGLTAALQARLSPNSPSVLLIDKCEPKWAGGNGFFTAGAYRTAHNGLQSLLPLVSNAPASAESKITLNPYTADDFTDDMYRVTEGKCDPDMTKELVAKSFETVKWLKENAHVNWQLSFKRQAYEVDGHWTFWGGLHLTVDQGGKGLIKNITDSAKAAGVVISFNTEATRLLTNEQGRVIGVEASKNGGAIQTIKASGVILCAGGFEASREMRAKYLGPNWGETACVRGTPHNNGKALEMTLRDVPAVRNGDYSSCHATCWNFEAPRDEGDSDATNEYTKSGYPLAVMVNKLGERFVDEGVDMRNYTYAKFGKAILQQPGGYAFQIFDERIRPWLRPEEYRDERIPERILAPSLEELAEKMKGDGLEQPDKFLDTMKTFNRATQRNANAMETKKWNPSVKDGVATQGEGLQLAKSNWALPIDKSPFMAVKVTTGITFTFGGLKINPETAGVVNGKTGEDIPGLFAAGEIVGGLFSGNYPGGSGLTAGGVWGRKAGRNAAALSARQAKI